MQDKVSNNNIYLTSSLRSGFAVSANVIFWFFFAKRKKIYDVAKNNLRLRRGFVDSADQNKSPPYGAFLVRSTYNLGLYTPNINIKSSFYLSKVKNSSFLDKKNFLFKKLLKLKKNKAEYIMTSNFGPFIRSSQYVQSVDSIFLPYGEKNKIKPFFPVGTSVASYTEKITPIIPKILLEGTDIIGIGHKQVSFYPAKRVRRVCEPNINFTFNYRSIKEQENRTVTRLHKAQYLLYKTNFIGSNHKKINKAAHPLSLQVKASKSKIFFREAKKNGFNLINIFFTFAESANPLRRKKNINFWDTANIHQSFYYYWLIPFVGLLSINIGRLKNPIYFKIEDLFLQSKNKEIYSQSYPARNELASYSGFARFAGEFSHKTKARSLPAFILDASTSTFFSFSEKKSTFAESANPLRRISKQKNGNLLPFIGALLKSESTNFKFDLRSKMRSSLIFFQIHSKLNLKRNEHSGLAGVELTKNPNYIMNINQAKIRSQPEGTLSPAKRVRSFCERSTPKERARELFWFESKIMGIDNGSNLRLDRDSFFKKTRIKQGKAVNTYPKFIQSFYFFNLNLPLKLHIFRDFYQYLYFKKNLFMSHVPVCGRALTSYQKLTTFALSDPNNNIKVPNNILGIRCTPIGGYNHYGEPNLKLGFAKFYNKITSIEDLFFAKQKISELFGVGDGKQSYLLLDNILKDLNFKKATISCEAGSQKYLYRRFYPCGVERILRTYKNKKLIAGTSISELKGTSLYPRRGYNGVISTSLFFSKAKKTDNYVASLNIIINKSIKQNKILKLLHPILLQRSDDSLTLVRTANFNKSINLPVTSEANLPSSTIFDFDRNRRFFQPPQNKSTVEKNVLKKSSLFQKKQKNKNISLFKKSFNIINNIKLKLISSTPRRGVESTVASLFFSEAKITDNYVRRMGPIEDWTVVSLKSINKLNLNYLKPQRYNLQAHSYNSQARSSLFLRNRGFKPEWLTPLAGRTENKSVILPRNELASYSGKTYGTENMGITSAVNRSELYQRALASHFINIEKLFRHYNSIMTPKKNFFSNNLVIGNVIYPFFSRSEKKSTSTKRVRRFCEHNFRETKIKRASEFTSGYDSNKITKSSNFFNINIKSFPLVSNYMPDLSFYTDVTRKLLKLKDFSEAKIEPEIKFTFSKDAESVLKNRVKSIRHDIYNFFTKQKEQQLTAENNSHLQLKNYSFSHQKRVVLKIKRFNFTPEGGKINEPNNILGKPPCGVARFAGELSTLQSKIASRIQNNIWERSDLIENTNIRLLKTRKNVQKKRRKKKLKKETRRRKKRKRFYPRPIITTFKLFKNFLQDIKNKKTKGRFLSGFTQKRVGAYNIFPTFVGSLLPIKRSAFKFNTSQTVLNEFRRLSWKSAWMRSNFSPYLTRVNIYLKKIKNSISCQAGKSTGGVALNNREQLFLNFNLRKPLKNKVIPPDWGVHTTVTPNNFLEVRRIFEPASQERTIYNSTPQGVLNKAVTGKLYNYNKVRSPKGLCFFTQGVKKRTICEPASQDNKNNKWKIAYKTSEYNRILYQRIQDIIFNIKENITLNGQNKVRAYKNGLSYSANFNSTNISNNKIKESLIEDSFIKKYILKLVKSQESPDKQNPQSSTSKNYPNLKVQTTLFNLKNLLQPYFDFSKLRLYWGINKTKTNKKIINVWSKQKLRESASSGTGAQTNKTKKLLSVCSKKLEKILNINITFAETANPLRNRRLFFATQKITKLNNKTNKRTSFKNMSYERIPSFISLDSTPRGDLNYKYSEIKEDINISIKNKEDKLAYFGYGYARKARKLALASYNGAYNNKYKLAHPYTQKSSAAYFRKTLNILNPPKIFDGFNLSSQYWKDFKTSILTNQNKKMALPTSISPNSLRNPYIFRGFFFASQKITFEETANPLRRRELFLIWFSILVFHFCCFISLISIPPIRCLLKSGLIFLSKFTSNSINLLLLFPNISNLSSLDASLLNIGSLRSPLKIKKSFQNKVIKAFLPVTAKVHFLRSKKPNSFTAYGNKKNLRFWNTKNIEKKFYIKTWAYFKDFLFFEKSFTKQKIFNLIPAFLFMLSSSKALNTNNTKSQIFSTPPSKNIGYYGGGIKKEKFAESANPLRRGFMSNFNIINFYILKTLHFAGKNIYKSSSLSYTYLMRSISLTSNLVRSVLSSIFVFLEKPGELFGDWLAFAFLVEWSSDLSNTIPEKVDYSFYSTFSKIIKLYEIQPLIHNRFLKFFDIFFVFLNQPDTDLIHRQKKGFIFWDLWADYLVEIAEKSNINIATLSNNKEEQNLLLQELRWSGLQPVIISEADNNSITEGALSPTERDNLRTRFAGKFKIPLFGVEEAWVDRPATLVPISKIKNGEQNKSRIIRDGFGKGRNDIIVHKTHPRTRSALLSFRSKKVAHIFPKLIKGFNFSFADQKSVISHNMRWSVNPNLKNNNNIYNTQNLFIDIHPPKSLRACAHIKNYSLKDTTKLAKLFKSKPSAYKGPHKNNVSEFGLLPSKNEQPICNLVCQVFSGIFYKQVSKNLLILGRSNQKEEKSLLVQAIAGETELRIITDNAYRYSMVYQGVAVGIKLLRDVFDAIALHTPCLFLLEDIHAIGERRPLLISDGANTESLSSGSEREGFPGNLEDSHSANQILYQLSKHTITHYKKPFKGDFSLSIPTNVFSFDLFSSLNFKPLLKKIKLAPLAPPKSKVFDTNNKILNTKLEKKTNPLLAPPATSPFSVLILKEQQKKPTSSGVDELPWEGLPAEQLAIMSKSNYSVRVKVALLADLAMSNLSDKLDMITDLLVIIDSVRGNRGFVVFATTHLPFILDPALRRPGRLDETLTLSLTPTIFNKWESLKLNILAYNDNLSFSLYNNTNPNNIWGLDVRRNCELASQEKKASLKDYRGLNVRRNCEPASSIEDLFLASPKINEKQIVHKISANYSNNLGTLGLNTLIFNKSLNINKQKLNQNINSSQNPHNIWETRFDSTPHYNFGNEPNNILGKPPCGVARFAGELSNFQSKIASRIQNRPVFTSFRDAPFFHISGANANELSLINFLGVQNRRFFQPSQCIMGGVEKRVFSLLKNELYNKRGEKRVLAFFIKNQQKTNILKLKNSINTQNLKIKILTRCASSGECKRRSIAKLIYLKLKNKIKNKMSQTLAYLLDSSSFKLDVPHNTQNIMGGVESALAYDTVPIFISLYGSKMVLKKYILKLVIDHISDFYININKTLISKQILNYNNVNINIKRIQPVFEDPNIIKDALFSNFSIKNTFAESPKIMGNPLRRAFHNYFCEAKMHNESFNYLSSTKIKQNGLITSLLFSFIQKRYVYQKNLIIPQLLSLGIGSNSGGLDPKDLPSPPASNILLPAKKYENFKRLNFFSFNVSKDTFSIDEKIQNHNQQILLKDLFLEQPISSSIKNNKISHRLDSTPTNNSRAQGCQNSLLVSLKKQLLQYTSSRGPNIPTSTNLFYRYRIYNRHKNYLSNLWSNAQLPEHNIEATFLSDIDWRSKTFKLKKDSRKKVASTLNGTSTKLDNLDNLDNKEGERTLVSYKFSASHKIKQKISDINDCIIDFPDADQYYNPRNRRWFLTYGTWNSWFDFNQTEAIINSYILECLSKAFNVINQNREILDYLAVNNIINKSQYLYIYTLLRFK